MPTLVEQQISTAMAMVEQNNATNTKFDDLATQLADIVGWLKTVDTTTKGLAASTSLLQLQAEDTASRLSVLKSTGVHRPPLGAASTTAPPAADVRVDNHQRAYGHGATLLNRGQVAGVHRSTELPLSNGMMAHARNLFDTEPELDGTRTHTHRSRLGSTPKMDFPKFDGEDHQVWIHNCDLYFESYGVSEHMKVKFAALNVVGDAAFWLKMVQKQRRFTSWVELCEAVVARWGKNKHTYFMRPVSGTKPHVSHSQPSTPDGMVDDSMIVPQTTESHEMKVHKILNPTPEVQTVECVPPGQQSQLYEKSAHSTTHGNIWEQRKEEIAEYFTKSKQNEQEAQRKYEEEDPESGAIVKTIVGLDPFCDDAFELFDPGINTSEQQFSYALPVQYLQQLQQHKTCQPVVSADCALLANNPVMSLQSLQLSKLLVNEFEGSADFANQLVIPGDIHSTTVNSLSQQIFYIGKPPIRYSGFVMPLSEEQQVIPVKGTCASATVPVPTSNEGCEIKHGLLLLHYSTPKDKPLLSWDPGEHEIFVRFSDTSAATHRQKLLMLAGNWHFMNLEEFKVSGDYTYTGYQPQARRICSSYSLAGSLDRHMSCGIVLLDIFFQQFFAGTYQVSTSQLMVCQHVQILVTNHCRSAPDYQILFTPSIIHCDAAFVRSLYNLIVNPTHLILVWCASRLSQALHSLGEHSSGCDNSCNCSLIILQWVTASPSDVMYLHTYTLSLFKSVPYLLINLWGKGVPMVLVLYSSVVLQVLQSTYISSLDMTAQGDLHDTLAQVLAGNIVATYMRISAPVLLQAEKYFLLDFSLFFGTIVNLLYIATVEVSPNALHEHVQRGIIATYLHWIQCSDFINLKAFLRSKDSSLWWFPAYKRTLSQWDPGIIASDLHNRVEMPLAWQDSTMNQVSGPLIRYSCMFIRTTATIWLPLAPVALLQARHVQRGRVAVPQVQVTWNASSTSTTSEGAFVLHHHFPDCIAWGQATAQGVGHVRAQPMPGSKKIKKYL